MPQLRTIDSSVTIQNIYHRYCLSQDFDFRIVCLLVSDRRMFCLPACWGIGATQVVQGLVEQRHLQPQIRIDC